MKLLILLSCLIMQQALAVFPQIDVKNVHGDYLDDNGQAYAQKAFYVLPNVKIKHENNETFKPKQLHPINVPIFTNHSKFL